jgi:Amt family ammonium transporter
MVEGQNPMAAMARPSGPGRKGPPAFSSREFEPGHLAWVTVAALGSTLTIPGWLFFYCNAAGSRNLGRAAGQLLLLTVLLSLGWGVVLYSMAFGLNWGADAAVQSELSGPDGSYTGLPLIGGTSNRIWQGLEPQVAADSFEYPLRRRRDSIPHILFMVFQMMLALAAPAPLVVLLSDRIRTGPLVAAALGWVALVYVPVTHWIRGFGWLRQMGVQDFAAGSALQMAVGFSVLGILPLLPRRSAEPVPAPEPQVGVVCAGGLLIWVGALFINGASALSASPAAVAAILCAHLAACAGAVGWAGSGWLRTGRAGSEELVLGAVAGLAAIAAGSGFVAPQSALIIGLVSGIVCRALSTACASRSESLVLRTFAIQGVGGALGLLFTGIFASSNFAGINDTGRAIDGLLSTDATMLLTQARAALAVAVIAPVGSLVVFASVRAVVREGWAEPTIPPTPQTGDR